MASASASLRAGAGAVEVAHQRLGETAARVAERVALALRHDGPELGPVAVGLAVAPAVGRVQAVGRVADAAEGADGAGAARGDESLQGPPLEPAVPAERRERGDATLVRPAAERVGIDAEQPARLAERQPFRRGSFGARPGVRHESSVSRAPSGAGRVVGNLGKPRSLHANVAGGV